MKMTENERIMAFLRPFASEIMLTISNPRNDPKLKTD